MPELPEVETISRGLDAAVSGQCIEAVDVRRPSVVKGDLPAFVAGIAGRTVSRVWRRAKLLILDLDGPDGVRHLAVHLKMTGRFWVAGPQDVPGSHTHIVFRLDDGRLLYFQDQRRFGSCRLLTPQGLREWDFFAALGPEPLEMTPAAFAGRFNGRGARIKAMLLDQRVVAGLGNIYADEALHLAGVHPMTRACELNRRQLDRLHKAVQSVLTKAIGLGGSTFRDFLNAHGRPGNYQDEFLAYGRAGEKCRSCRTVLAATRVAGRTSTFCPCCQKE